MYEAICFLSFGKVFTGFQTVNLVFPGIGAAGTRPPLGPNPVTVIISLVAFAVGAGRSTPTPLPEANRSEARRHPGTTVERQRESARLLRFRHRAGRHARQW